MREPVTLTFGEAETAPSISAEASRIVAWADAGKLADDEWLVENNETAIIDICRSHAAVLEALGAARTDLDLLAGLLKEATGAKYTRGSLIDAAIAKADGAAPETDRSGSPMSPSERIREATLLDAERRLQSFLSMKVRLKSEIIDLISAKGGLHDARHTSNQLDDMLDDCFGKRERELEAAIDEARGV